MPEAVRLLVASRNAKKLKELRRVLEAAGVSGIDLVGLDEVPPFPEAPETAASFEGNALAKARDGAAATGLPCVADDSGLEVDALNAMPGVLSARWSGGHGDDAANTALVLAQLSDMPDERRGAAFVSACALVVPGGDESVVRGTWPGTIAREPRGDGGFGYDPVFVPEGESRSAAQLTPEEKDAASHRGRALAQLVPAIAALAGS
ncbi:RdgB/HAM1 family non-canonical purine NTP pyrophosphatase [Rhodococcus oryzae]|uniref:dITP/XTP pyrophosphatase n=1 Tax=Rhodococcus oryzae TaxID=2571143 RepID=A0ABY2RK32_9NOCA|nr:RdgB/HAM1 family non-canonical purine NTP pyrophosphatase [Rhodococcus oryzae]TJZ78038.1 RdgB/HAM1 family non-canonical purine NTP pyrophosphatase [Rhodococcus oryzae]